jgi:transposase
VKSLESRKALGLLTARSVLRSKARDLDNAVRGVLLSFGLKLPKGADQSFATRVRNLTRRDPYLGGLVEPLVRMREALRDEAIKLERRIRDLACSDEVCRRLMTAPAIGPLTALTYRAVIDEPKRFGRSRDVGPHLGLTPSIHQSGDVERRGHITRYGDRDLRRLLFLAALTQLRRSTKPSRLNTWGRQIAGRRGKMRAIVAIARRLAVTLHAMWISETDFRWTGEAA